MFGASGWDVAGAILLPMLAATWLTWQFGPLAALGILAAFAACCLGLGAGAAWLEDRRNRKDGWG